MLLAHFLWEATPRGRAATAETWAIALDRVLDVEVGDELRAIWSGLATGQRRALVAIAENAAPLYSRRSQREHGSSRGGGLRTAVQALVDLGEAVRDERTVTDHRVVDPVLAHWVRGGRDDA